MSSIGGAGEPTHTRREIRMYEQEYKDSAELFQKAVQEYAKSNNPYQKKEFQGVMDKALAILNETARELNRKALLDQNTKITKDYDTFNKTPEDEKAITQLEKDLEQAKESV
jgi:Skp family chaperone for outer membrane proteins